MIVQQALAAPGGDIFRRDLPNLIGSIGQSNFASRLVGFLYQICGAEHTALFYLNNDNVTGVATASIDGTPQNEVDMSVYLQRALWKSDPTFLEVKSQLGPGQCATARTDIANLSDEMLREVIYGRRGIRDRVLIGARTEDAIVGLSMCSSKVGFFEPENKARIEAISEALFALLAKHIDIHHKSADVAPALTSLEEIENCICRQMPSMPRREAEVCSRVIYGVSSLGISLELGISVETVMTYRKRAYSRLNIATQRELIVWYLGRWSEWRNSGARREMLH